MRGLYWIGLDWTEQGLTSHSTHVRSFRRQWGDCGISQDCSHSRNEWMMTTMTIMRCWRTARPTSPSFIAVAFGGRAGSNSTLRLTHSILITTERRRQQQQQQPTAHHRGVDVVSPPGVGRRDACMHARGSGRRRLQLNNWTTSRLQQVTTRQIVSAYTYLMPLPPGAEENTALFYVVCADHQLFVTFVTGTKRDFSVFINCNTKRLSWCARACNV